MFKPYLNGEESSARPLPVKVEMLNPRGLDLPVIPVVLGAPFSIRLFMFCSGTSAKRYPSHFPQLPLALPPWQIFRFIYDTKSKPSGLLLSCWSGFCEKLLGKFLTLGQEK